MVHPSLSSVILTPISPRTLSFRPVVLPSKVVVKLQASFLFPFRFSFFVFRSLISYFIFRYSLFVLRS